MTITAGQLVANRYQIERNIGEGGMGLVWLARDKVSGQFVIMKEARIRNDPHSDTINIEKLKFEMEVLRLLQHKNVVRVVDELMIDGSPVLILEFIQGEILEKVGAGRPLEDKEVRRVATQLLDAVDYIHSLNLIHRDIAPKNVFASDPLKLIDFGTAKFFYSQAAKPEAIVSPGGYTPPEQYRYASSPQGDLWSVGATVFFASTGQNPILALGNYPQDPIPADPRVFNRDVSEPVRQLVLKATQADPTRRFSTAKEMQALLEHRRAAGASETRLVIKNELIPLEANSIILGRMERYERNSRDNIDSTSGPNPLIATQDKCEIIREGDSEIVKIPDPLCYISRKHAEVFSTREGWFVRDLGSLNKTAVYSSGAWIELWKGHRVPSEVFPLHGGEWISLAYDAKVGPYMTALFRVN